jgi:hypothetical protein
MKRFLLLLFGIVTTIIVLATARGVEHKPFHSRAAAQEATPDDAVTIEPSATTEPTSIAEPTATAEPVSTEAPTSTPGPTSTAEPTSTDELTATVGPSATAEATSTAELTMTPIMELQQLTVRTVDELGEPLTDLESGACITVYASPYLGYEEGNDPVDSGCDGDDGSNDSRIIFPSLFAGGFYYLYEYRAPAGYGLASPNEFVQMKTDGPTAIKVAHDRLQRVTFHLVDEFGNGLFRQPYSVCIELGFYIARAPESDDDWVPWYRACDTDDGTNDGTITFPAVGPRWYDLEGGSVIDGYQARWPYSIMVAVGEPTEITVVYTHIGEEPTANPAATATVRPPTSSAPEHPTESGDVIELPDTGSGSKTESGSGVLLILASVVMCGLFGTAIWTLRCAHRSP